MNTKLRKIAAAIALLIGAITIFAGGQVVLLGKVMDYYVIDWLPVFNLIVGIISVFVTAILIWKGSRVALPAAVATLIAHSIVMVVLQAAYRDMVASESIKATTVRIILWLIIVTLMLIQARQDRRSLD